MLDPTVAAPHFFLVGAPRSGTTLLRSIVANHEQVHIPAETGFLPRLLRLEGVWRGRPELFVRLAFANGRLTRMGLAPDRLLETLTRDESSSTWIDSLYRYAVGVEASSNFLVGDKTPNYGLHWRLLSRSFPSAVFVTIVRDPRRVVSSLLAQSWGPTTAFYAARLWQRNALATLEMEAELGDHRHVRVSYEDLIEDPAAVVAELCLSLGLAFDTRMVNERKGATEMQGANFHPESHQHLGAAIEAKPQPHVLTDAEMAAISCITSKDALQFGYDIDEISAPARHERVRWHAREAKAKAKEQRNRLRTVKNLLSS